MPQKINMFLTTNKNVTNKTLSSNSIMRNTITSSTLTLGNLKQIYMNRNVSCGWGSSRR